MEAHVRRHDKQTHHAQTHGGHAWRQPVDLVKFTNPVSGKIEPKAMYCEPSGDLIVCGGVYLK